MQLQNVEIKYNVQIFKFVYALDNQTVCHKMSLNDWDAFSKRVLESKRVEL